MPKPVLIPLKDVMLPTDLIGYLRESIDPQKVQDYVRVAEEAPPPHWPFPPITLAPAQMFLAAGADPAILGSAKWVVVDGVNRYETAKVLKRAKIPAVVSTAATPLAAAIEQLTLNLSHGFKVDLDARDRWIHYLHRDMGATLGQLRQALGGALHKSSLSRILSGKQRGAKTAKRKAQKRRGEKQVSEDRDEYLAETFAERLDMLAAEYAEHHAEVRAWYQDHGIDPGTMKHLTEFLAGFRSGA